MAQQNDNLPINTEPEIHEGGTITYANEVIAIISGIAASEIEGIAGMVTAGGLSEIISKNRNITRGVKVEVGTEEVSVDLYTTVEYGQPIQKVASEVQENVRKSIESMTGLHVARVDIHVQGVSFEKDKQDSQSRLEAANIQGLMSPKQEKKSKKAEKEAKAQEAKQNASPLPEEPKAQSEADEQKEEPPGAEVSLPEEAVVQAQNEAREEPEPTPETSTEEEAVKPDALEDESENKEQEPKKAKSSKKSRPAPSRRRTPD